MGKSDKNSVELRQPFHGPMGDVVQMFADLLTC
jgi:hypothetical protein